MARVITVGNRKGGSGKTTTAVSLAAGLAHGGRRVLLVDLDPQAHATLTLGIRDPGANDAYAVLVDGASVAEQTRPTVRPRLDLLPGSRRLADFERRYTPVKEARRRMAAALERVTAGYDHVVFDTPPTLGLLTVSALLASCEVVVPMQAHYLALDGLAEMVRMVQTINRVYATGLVIRGVVPTFHQERTRLSQAVLAEVRSHLGDSSVLPAIRSCVALAEAPSHGETIYQYAPLSSGAQDYQRLVRDIDPGIAGEAVAHREAS